MRSLVLISLLFSSCKSETQGEWDKEIDLREYGFLFQLKYDEPLNPLKGGKVHLELQKSYLYLPPHVVPFRELHVDFGFSEGEEVGDGLFKGQVRYTYKTYRTNTTGSFDFETRFEEGIWKLLAGEPPLSMPLIQVEAGVKYPEKTTKVRAIVKGGPSLDLAFTAIFNGSGFGVFGGFGDLASLEMIFNGARLLLSRDTSSTSKWSLQLSRPREHYDVGESDPTYNFTIELQDNGWHVSDLKITGELNQLADIGLSPWDLMGYNPGDIELNEGGPWRMLIELTTKKTSSMTSLMQLVAKFTSSEEKDINILRFHCTKRMLKNSTTLPSPEEPFVIDIDYTLGDGKWQHFEKVNIITDLFKGWTKNLEISLQNENKPENEFSYKLQYDMKSHQGGSGDYVSCFNYISLMESGCTGCPNRTIEKLSGNYSWTDLPEKFELRSEDNFYSEAQRLETAGSGFPLVWLGRLYERAFWISLEWHTLFYHMEFESSFPLFGLARIMGVKGNEPNIGKPTMQLKAIRQLVFEKNTIDRFLNFYGRTLERTGKMSKFEQTVMAHGEMWHYLDYKVTSQHKRSLIWETVQQQTWFGDRPRFPRYGASHSKFTLDDRPTYGHGESLENILASAGGFIFSYKDAYAYDGHGNGHALDIAINFLEYPKTRGLKCLFEWKLAPPWKTKGSTSVFKYDGHFVWITDEEVLEKVFALETKERMIQTEESPFYRLLDNLGLISGPVTEANIASLFHWDKTFKTGRVIRNGAEIVKIRDKSSDWGPSLFSFEIKIQLPRVNQSSCLPDESCLVKEIQVELQIPLDPINNFHDSLLEMNINIGSDLTRDKEFETKTKVKLEWEGLGQTGEHYPLKYNITNEILFEGTRRGRSEINVDGEGEIGLGLDERGNWDSGNGMYWVDWTGSCWGSSEDTCAYFGIPEIRNLTLMINLSPGWYQHSMFRMFGRFGNETDTTGLELDVDKITVFGF